MNARTRLKMTAAALLVGAVTSACGGADGGGADGGGADGGGAAGGGAPSDASEVDFCDTQVSLIDDLLPDDMTNPEVPSNEEMATAVKDWGQRLEDVGTPEDISQEARRGFEAVVQRARDINVEDFSIEKLEELEQGGQDASDEAREQAQAFSDYLVEKCGNPMDDLELPELPEMPGSTE